MLQIEGRPDSLRISSEKRRGGKVTTCDVHLPGRRVLVEKKKKVTFSTTCWQKPCPKLLLRRREKGKT